MIEIAAEPFDSVDGRVLHGAYFAELRRRFPKGYEPGDVHPTLARDLSPPIGVFLIARNHGAAVGCAGMKQLDDETAEVKHMYLVPSQRGAGTGVRILQAVEEAVRSRGLRKAVLDTNGSLTEAVSMYERNGYVSIPPYNDNEWATHWFEKDLAG